MEIGLAWTPHDILKIQPKFFPIEKNGVHDLMDKEQWKMAFAPMYGSLPSSLSQTVYKYDKKLQPIQKCNS
jgi:hypothetical protein